MRQNRTKKSKCGPATKWRLLPKRWKALWIALAVVIVLGVAAVLLINPPEILETVLPEDDYTGDVIDISDMANRKDGWYTFVLAGTDNGGGNSDTLMVGAISCEDKKLTVASVPRDTLINVSRSVKKINSAYMTGGIEGLQKELKKIMGFVPDSYAVVDLKAFEKLVDAIGGVDFDVPIDMDYEDPAQDLYIHIKEGPQHLNGKEALKVMRFRYGYPEGDLGRIKTQQALCKEIADQCLTVGNIKNIKDFAKIVEEYVDTNLTFGNIVWYGNEFLKLKEGTISFETMPTNLATIKGGSYVSIDVDKWLTMINESLNPYDTAIRSSNLNILTMSNGELYSTSGVIAGGEDSFLNYYRLNGQVDPEEAERLAAEAAKREEEARQEEENNSGEGAAGTGETGSESGTGSETEDPGWQPENPTVPEDPGIQDPAVNPGSDETKDPGTGGDSPEDGMSVVDSLAN